MTQKALLQAAGDGTAVPAGYVGQVLQVTGASTTGLTVSLSNITSLTLTPGVWIINGGAQISGSGGSYFSLGISTTSASSVGTIVGYSYYPFAANGSAGVASGIVNIYVNISANTTYYLIGGTNMTGLTSGAGSLTAIRIA